MWFLQSKPISFPGPRLHIGAYGFGGPAAAGTSFVAYSSRHKTIRHALPLVDFQRVPIWISALA